MVWAMVMQLAPVYALSDFPSEQSHWVFKQARAARAHRPMSC